MMIIDPYRFASKTNIHAIDAFQNNLWAVFGLVKHLNLYSGACIRVRRSIDNLESDINFVSDVLDISSLLSFVGGGDGFITKYYDQTENSRNFLQISTDKQPKIVTSGVYNGKIVFDGVSNFLKSSINSSGTNTGVSVFMSGKLNSIQGYPVYIELTPDGVATAGGYTLYGNPSENGIDMHSGGPPGQSGAIFGFSGSILNDNVHAYIGDRTKPDTFGQHKFYVNGAPIIQTSANGYGYFSGNYANDTWNVGGRISGNYAQLELSSLAIYESAVDIDYINGVTTAFLG